MLTVLIDMCYWYLNMQIGTEVTGGFPGSWRRLLTECSSPSGADRLKWDSQVTLGPFLHWGGALNRAPIQGAAGPTLSPVLLFAKLCAFGQLHEPQFSQL